MTSLANAKTRLADTLTQEERAELALAMLTDVLVACRDAGVFDTVAVISRDSEVFWHAREQGAKPLAEPATLSGLNEGLTFGQRYLARRVAASELVIFPADIPLIRPDDVRAIAATLDGDPPRGAIVRARDGGTNALALRPPELVPMRYGPNSADAHVAAAREAGVELIELALERVAFDVDSPADLAAMASMAVGAATAGWLEARADYARRTG